MGLDLGRAPLFCWWNWGACLGGAGVGLAGLGPGSRNLPESASSSAKRVLITVATHPSGLQEAPLRGRMLSLILGWCLVDSDLSECCCLCVAVLGPGSEQGCF